MITVDQKCLDCDSDINFIEGDAMTRGAIYKWECTNKDCQARFFSDEVGNFQEDI